MRPVLEGETRIQYFQRTLREHESDECLLWPFGKTGGGYGKISPKCSDAHREAWKFYNGTPPPKMCVCHKCDTPSCYNIRHLFLGSYQDNTNDKLSKGRGLFGELHQNSKTTEATVIKVKTLRKAGMKYKLIAVETGLTFKHIAKICENLIWRHIEV